jgi:hypothetical protein
MGKRGGYFVKRPVAEGPDDYTKYPHDVSIAGILKK